MKGAPAYRIEDAPCIYKSEEAARNAHKINNLSPEIVVFSVNCIGEEWEVES